MKFKKLAPPDGITMNKVFFTSDNAQEIMGNLDQRLTFDPSKTNKIFHDNSKEHLKIGKIAKFVNPEMLLKKENIAWRCLRICSIYL